MSINSRDLNRMIKSPRLLAEYQRTGRVPESLRPTLKSPLITLLDSIFPRDRLQITGIKITPALGYTGSRQFHNAQQALNWVRPTDTYNPVCESWRIKNFHKALTIDDLAALAAAIPQRVVDDWWRRHKHLSHLRVTPAQDPADEI